MTEQKLNHNQQIAAQYMGDALCILASAGCGKTTVLVAHYLELLQKKKLRASQIVVTTFSQKSAADIKEKIFQKLNLLPEKQILDEFLQAPISTLHGLAGRILRDSSLLLGMEPHFKILDENESTFLKTQALQEIFSKLLQHSSPDFHFLLKAYGWNKTEAELFRMLREWPEWKDIFTTSLLVCSVEEEKYKLAFQSVFLEILSKYEELKKTRDALDFNDLEEKAIELLQKNPWVIQHYQKHWKAFLIDEFQDTSSRQDLLLSLLLNLNFENPSPTKSHLTLVGDPKQSIYGFRGAKSHIFEKYQDYINQVGGLTITLSENYRSPHSILNFVNALFTKVFNHYSPLLGPQDKDQAICMLRSPDENDLLNIQDKRQKEAALFANHIHQLLRDGAQAQDIYLLFRSSTSMPIYLKIFQAHKLPVFVKSGESLLQRQEIQDLLHAMRVLQNPHDALSWIGLLRSPAFSLSDECLLEFSLDHPPKADWSKIHPLAHKILLQNPEQSPTEFLDWWFQESQIISIYGADPRLESKSQNILQFYHFCFEWENEHSGKLKAFLKEMELLLNENIKINALSDQMGSGNNITFMTIHQSKGLDLPIVYLPDLKPSSHRPESKALICRFENEWGVKLPDSKKGLKKHVKASQAFQENLHKTNLQQEEEENRIFYVACTRSTQKLILGFLPKAPENKKEDSALNARHLLYDLASSLPSIHWISEKPLPEENNISKINSGSAPVIKFPVLKQNRLLHFSVTQLETYLRSAEEYSERYVHNIPADIVSTPGKDSKASELSAMERGQILHEALCLYSRNPTSSNIIPNLSAKHHWGTKHEKEILALDEIFQKCIQMPNMKNILHAEEAYSEIPFRLLLGSFILQGAMDRLIRNNSEWSVVDYKTHTLHSAQKSSKHDFEFQLKTYCLAASKMLHKSVCKAQVYFVISHTTHDYSFTEEELQDHEIFLRNLMQEINDFIYSRTYGSSQPSNQANS